MGKRQRRRARTPVSSQAGTPQNSPHKVQPHKVQKKLGEAAKETSSKVRRATGRLPYRGRQKAQFADSGVATQVGGLPADGLRAGRTRRAELLPKEVRKAARTLAVMCYAGPLLVFVAALFGAVLAPILVVLVPLGVLVVSRKNDYVTAHAKNSINVQATLALMTALAIPVVTPAIEAAFLAAREITLQTVFFGLWLNIILLWWLVVSSKGVLASIKGRSYRTKYTVVSVVLAAWQKLR